MHDGPALLDVTPTRPAPSVRTHPHLHPAAAPSHETADFDSCDKRPHDDHAADRVDRRWYDRRR
ncbi:hypothetical protein SSBG_02407 [Streptomyces sp. SPB074]|nr:hypothetical protein SSBG_02407 [Streptomyces sp. SPB074]